MALKESHYVIGFHFIDDLRCLRPLCESLTLHFFEPDPSETNEQERQLRNELIALFNEAGWEGDGEIKCIFVAPCFTGRRDGLCDIVYHVKQRNDGTSWLAIPLGLSLSSPKKSW
jgi:hypothetical protein